VNLSGIRDRGSGIHPHINVSDGLLFGRLFYAKPIQVISALIFGSL